MAKGLPILPIIIGAAGLFMMSRKKAGAPPPSSVSKDPAGYNTKLWSSPAVARSVLHALGYDVAVEGADDPSGQAVAKFQHDYDVASKEGFMSASGRLASSDGSYSGIVTNATRNAMEIILFGGAAPDTAFDILATMPRAVVWGAKFNGAL